MSLLSVACAFLFASAAQASYLNNDLSFGATGKIPDKNIPNFHIHGAPEVLSNKVVLTPPAPGNQRGALWSDKILQNSLWTVDLDFRATGPERGGGNLQLYYAKDGENALGTSSIYTAGKWDGLAIVIDQYSGSGGFIRGFLNAGDLDYKSHHSVDSLAFGHCTYSYRNLGRPSRLQIQQTQDSFKVLVDNKPCFESSKIKLPLGYNFGLVAATSETPDSFEIFKFVTSTENHSPDNADGSPSSPSTQEPLIDPKQDLKKRDSRWTDNNNEDFKEPPEVPATDIKSQDAQFADLHNRLQAMTRQFSLLTRDFQAFQSTSAIQNEALSAQLSRIESTLSQLDSLPGIGRKLDGIEKVVRQTKEDVHNALDKKIAGLRMSVQEVHHGLISTVGEHALNLGSIVLVVVGSQALTVVAYAIYKKRKNAGGKKYL